MSVKAQHQKLVENEVFAKWKQKNDHCYLAHAFMMLDAENNGEWQFGFYNDQTDLMITFFIDAGGVSQSPETEIFKHEESKVRELNMDDVKVDFEESLAAADKCQNEDYKGEIPIKKIFILQNIEQGVVWNISYLTAKFNVLNLKIDASSKEILEHKKISMLDFVSTQKGGDERDTNYIQ